jgi:hypothetical protein
MIAPGPISAGGHKRGKISLAPRNKVSQDAETEKSLEKGRTCGTTKQYTFEYRLTWNFFIPDQ